MATIVQTPQRWKQVSAAEWYDWRWQLAHCLQGREALLEWLAEHGDNTPAEELGDVLDRYRFRAVPYYLSLADWTDPHDPIRRQCLPDRRELELSSHSEPDPFREREGTGVPGVVHRFPDRVLIVASTECAVYCRHCTRKNTLEELVPPRNGRFDAAIDYISARPEVREVLISGGDPLLLETDSLDELLTRVLAISHVEVVRIGTRIPVVLPMRVDDALVRMLARHRPLWINTQFNHPRELSEEALTACRKLTDSGIPVSNQCVLLRGINDELGVMRKLCTELQRNMIRPYYVFQCDPIPGISHFRTSLAAGRELQEALRASVGGLCLPAFVADIPGASGKTPLGWAADNMSKRAL